jgi:hypothetical protein
VKHLPILFLLLAGQIASSQKTLLFKEAKIPHPTVDLKIQDWNRNQSNFTKLSPLEQEFYYWVNYGRSNPHRFFDSLVLPLTDLYPQLKGDYLESLRQDLNSSSVLPLLNLNIDLITMAGKHALDIVSSDSKPSHSSTNGDSFSDRFKKTNLKDCGAENLSFGAGDPVFLLVLLYLDINVPDLGHRKTLLNPAYEETGIGAEKYKNGSVFIVEDFACPQR